MSRSWMLSLALSALCVGCCARREAGQGAARSVQSGSALEAADSVVVALRDRDGAALASLVHPQKGVRLSPSAYVDVAQDRVLSASQVESLWSDTRSYRWGYAEGSGDPIELSPGAYVARYALVGSQDFTHPSSVNVNDDRAAGNTRNNAAEVYPAATRVERIVDPSGGGAAGGSDWVALRLVFEERDGRWWLVGVIHDAWSP